MNGFVSVLLPLVIGSIGLYLLRIPAMTRLVLAPCYIAIMLVVNVAWGVMFVCGAFDACP
ncbi:hypothetical protein NTCA1_56100 [Novosphingobium sp. TCA1]|nr:hypothetical protein NTCA1_56100 [Novosphingobium sp. TCA1]